MSNQLSSYLAEHGFHILNMKPEFVKVQKHAINESFLVTIPLVIAQAIPVTKGDTMKTVLDSNKRIIMEKV
jgi:hypothetical protein